MDKEEFDFLMTLVSPDMKVSFSQSYDLQIKSVPQEPVVGFGAKPAGFWYACGDSWIEWLRSEMPDWLKRYKSLYSVDINYSKILKIGTEEEFSEFEKKFLTIEQYGRSLPNWKAVAEEYSGIEICPYLWGFRDSFWYYGWDVGSGCIWDKSAIRGVRLIAKRDESTNSWISVKEETDFVLPSRINSSIEKLLESLTHQMRSGRKLLSEGVNLDGEYWITPDGDVIDASPGRHAEIATGEMFSKQPGGDHVLRWLQTVPDSYFYIGYARPREEVKPPAKAIQAAFEKEIAGVRGEKGHPVDFMILERGWIRNYDDAFDVDVLSDKNIKTISELLWSIYHVSPEDAGDEIIFVREHSTDKTYKIRIVDIMNEPGSVLQHAALRESLRGEFWIDDTGQDTFADGDLGDTNHEAYAFWSALGIDPDSKEVRDLDIYPGGGFSRKAIKWLRDEGANEEAIKFFQKGGDARDWAMEKMGWIRVDDELFQVYGLDDKKLERIMDFVWEDREYDPDGSITIEDLKTKKSYGIDYSEMDSINTVGDLYRKQDPDIRAPGQEVGKGVLPAGATDEPHFSLEDLGEALETKIPYLVKSFPDMDPEKAEELVRIIADSDPTESKKYLPWLVKQVKNKAIRLPEDSGRVTEVLKFFDKNKEKKEFKAVASNNIDTYKVFNDLEDVVDKMSGKDLKTGHEKRKEIKAKGAETVYEKSPWKVIKITTPEAATEYSRETKWCVSNLVTAADYLENGPLYYIFNNGDKFGLFHFNDPIHYRAQLMDVRDRPIKNFPDDLFSFFEAEATKINDAINLYTLTYRRVKKWEQQFGEFFTPEQALGYAQNIVGGKWPEGEDVIKSVPNVSFFYARDVLKDRWPEGEESIKLDQRSIYNYSKHVIKGRWPAGEGRLLNREFGDVNHLDYAFMYARNIIKGRWADFEDALLKSNSSYLASSYADEIIGGRWPEGEEIIKENPTSAVSYARKVIKGRWPEAEEFIKRDKEASIEYKNFLKSMKKEPEGAIAESICRLTSLIRS